MSTTLRRDTGRGTVNPTSEMRRANFRLVFRCAVMPRFMQYLSIAALLPVAAAIELQLPAALNTNAAGDTGADSRPQVATDKFGTWVAVWQSSDTLGNTIGSDADILVSRSTNKGKSWSPPAALNTNATTDAGEDTNPVLAVDPFGVWVCVWQSTTPLGITDGTDTDLFVSISDDDGVTWSDPEALNSTYESDGSAVDTSPTLACDSTGVLVCAWESDNTLGDVLEDDLDILFARSIDSGQTWSAAASIKSNAGDDATAFDRDACVAAGINGRFICAWESNDSLGGAIGTEGDILYAYSENNGSTWIGPLLLSVNTFQADGPDQNISLASDSEGKFLAVWDGSRDFGKGISDNDIFVAWSNNGFSWSFWADLSPDTAAGFLDQKPQAFTDSKSSWFVLWERTSDQGGSEDVDFMKSESFVLTSFFGTLPGNSNLDIDSGDDENIAAATDSKGNWVFVWDSDDTLGNTVGSDKDIFFANRKPGTSADLNLFLPDGSTVWKRGKKGRVKWTTTYHAGPRVKIELMRGNDVAFVIANEFVNRGKKGWKIPSNYPLGDNYRIRIRSAIYKDIKDVSKPFEIRAAK